MDKHPSSGKGSGKRGRPRVGEPKQVRLSDNEQELATTLGGGVLALGLRRALRITVLMQGRAAVLNEILSQDDGDFSPSTSLSEPQQTLEGLRQVLKVIASLSPSSELSGESKIDEFASDQAMALGIGQLFRAAEVITADQKRSESPVAANISDDDRATARELGGGSIDKGINLALGAVRFFGIETVKKLNHGPGTHKRSNND